MAIKIQIAKKNIFILVLAFILVSLGLSIAYNTLVANRFGHTAGEVMITNNSGQIKTLQQAIDQGEIFTLESGESQTFAEVGVRTGDENINIGAGRDCMTFVSIYFRSCSNGGPYVNCLYDKNTGILSGSIDSTCGYARCGYACFN